MNATLKNNAHQRPSAPSVRAGFNTHPYEAYSCIFARTAWNDSRLFHGPPATSVASIC